MTTNFQLLRMCANIPDFSGVFMIDEYVKRKKRPRKEKAVINLQTSKDIGSHWVGLKVNGNKVTFFDPFGDLPPPQRLIKYFGKAAKITYNYRRYQSFSRKNCGPLVVKFLKNKLS